MFDCILLIYFMILYNTVGMSHLKVTQSRTCSHIYQISQSVFQQSVLFRVFFYVGTACCKVDDIIAEQQLVMLSSPQFPVLLRTTLQKHSLIVNKAEANQVQQLVILLVINCSSTCFGRLYAHNQEVRLRFHCLWFSVLL